MDKKIAPQLEELTRALGDIEKSGIRAEFDKLLAFRVPPEVAKESILRKFGGTRKVLKVKDLSTSLKNFGITGRILDIGEKAIHPQEGAQEGPSRLYTGVLADETGSVMFSSWKELPGSTGDVINIRNAYTRLWQNRIRLSIGKQSLVSIVPDSPLPQLSELSKSPAKKLIDIGAVDFSVGTTACVLQLSHREVLIRGKQSKVISGVLADETARLPFSAWVELPGIDIGSTIRIEGAQVRMFRGMPSINILSSTKVSSVGPEEAEKLAFTFESAAKDPVPLKIEEIDSRDNMFDIVAAGNVVSVRPGSGIISRCPECSRVIQKSNCRAHGKVEGVRDMRIKAVLDDGTGAMSVMFPRELAETIYGKSLEEAEQLMFSDISKDAVYEDLRRILTGRYLAVRGNASKGEYGVSFVAESAWVPEDDLAVRVVELLHRLGKDEEETDLEVSGGEIRLA
ncbi:MULTISPECIES: Single-stranded DNA binding protein [unclassified Methanosarcina]|uniref:Single-stranded DNA binding protein n=1 Tax=unclassified Methanosarcina TaxID=2644672 RepID=UPI000615EC71|nr:MULTISPECIES: Single-stranded DNA binding protein [unclassified Methanosarcina]AKB19177.1 Replication factor-A protein 1 [Methanosarcina sp. WWM596]AKB22994.1 Replication factor-A protein 1 [Methanosarcina sp. WH1]